MNKILILDKRTSRQKEALSNIGIEVEEFDQIKGLFNLTGNECKKHLLHLEEYNREILNEFELFILHESDLSSVALKNITDYCSETEKSLILFSGSIQQNLYINEGFNMLSVNSKSLYSEKIIEFTKKFIASEISHLTELIYGNSWELNYALIYRQLLLDEINGDELSNLNSKADLLESCKSILGRKDKKSLDVFIDKKLY
jgi:hypothetical protein